MSASLPRCSPSRILTCFWLLLLPLILLLCFNLVGVTASSSATPITNETSTTRSSSTAPGSASSVVSSSVATAPFPNTGEVSAGPHGSTGVVNVANISSSGPISSSASSSNHPYHNLSLTNNTGAYINMTAYTYFNTFTRRWVTVDLTRPDYITQAMSVSNTVSSSVSIPTPIIPAPVRITSCAPLTIPSYWNVTAYDPSLPLFAVNQSLTIACTQQPQLADMGFVFDINVDLFAPITTTCLTDGNWSTLVDSMYCSTKVLLPCTLSTFPTYNGWIRVTRDNTGVLTTQLSCFHTPSISGPIHQSCDNTTGLWLPPQLGQCISISSSNDCHVVTISNGTVARCASNEIAINGGAECEMTMDQVMNGMPPLSVSLSSSLPTAAAGNTARFRLATKTALC